jgi:hypothetical protein
LGSQPAPFSFGEIMQRAAAIFEEPPPYEEIKDMILFLLGRNEKGALLEQRFDEERKELVLQPTP